MSVLDGLVTIRRLAGGDSGWARALFELLGLTATRGPPATETAPHVRADVSVRSIYRHFVWASLPVMLMWLWSIGRWVSGPAGGAAPLAGWRLVLLDAFGLAGPSEGLLQTMMAGLLCYLPVLLAALLTAVCWEIVFAAGRRRPVDDGWFTHCWLFALLLPMGVSLPLVVVGMSFGLVFGKHIFGGAGQYLVSPALLGVLFLLLGYPGALTGLPAEMGTTGASLQTAWSLLAGAGVEAAKASGVGWWQVFSGQSTGTTGALSALASVVGAAWLVAAGATCWRILGGALLGLIFITLPVAATVTPDPAWQLPWYWHLALGNFAFALAFLATDPTTAAITRGGRWLQGCMVSVLVVLMRVLDPAHPESTLFAVLLAGLFAPLIDHFVTRLHARRYARRMEAPK